MDPTKRQTTDARTSVSVPVVAAAIIVILVVVVIVQIRVRVELQLLLLLLTPQLDPERGEIHLPGFNRLAALRLLELVDALFVSAWKEKGVGPSDKDAQSRTDVSNPRRWLSDANEKRTESTLGPWGLSTVAFNVRKSMRTDPKLRRKGRPRQPAPTPPHSSATRALVGR